MLTTRIAVAFIGHHEPIGKEDEAVSRNSPCHCYMEPIWPFLTPLRLAS